MNCLFFEKKKKKKALLKDEKRRNKSRIYYSSKRVQHVKPMFEVIWMPILASVFGYLQESDDPSIVSLSIQSLSSAIRIASIFHMDLPLNSYLFQLNSILKKKED